LFVGCWGNFSKRQPVNWSTAKRHPEIPKTDTSFENDRKGLAFNLLIIQLLICLGYIAFDLLRARPFVNYFLPTLFATTIIVVILWIRKRYFSAIILDLVALNIMLFFISEELSVFTGVDLYYMAVGSATLALFGYEHWRAGLGFTLLSLSLFLTSRYFTFNMIPVIKFTARQEEIFFMINSTSAALISIYSVLTILRINFESKRKLYSIKDTIETQNQELTKTNEELDRFVYSASHDLRSPLSSIKGLVNVFELDEKANKEDYLSKIKSRIETMDKFIGEITNYSRNTRVEVSLELILLKPLIQEIIASLQYTGSTDKLVYEVEVSNDFVLRTDAYRLRIVLNNLISNAIKYSDLSKTKSIISIKAHKENQNSIIEVVDNGIGIKKEFQDKVFNMFLRATERSTGSGLGLYIVKESVKKMNGKIKLESEPNLGSTFTLVLPQ
jgi:signal transduction histidine kinase